MELILKEDVQNLGFKDDIVSVKNGYGRNFLIPQGKAVIATVSARKVLTENLKQRAFKEQSIIDAAIKRADEIKALDVKLPSKVGSGDKLFGSVTNSDLATAISALSSEIDKKYITLLESGGSLRYKELLKPFNLDPSDSNFWKKGILVIENLIDELEVL